MEFRDWLVTVAILYLGEPKVQAAVVEGGVDIVHVQVFRTNALNFEGVQLDEAAVVVHFEFFIPNVFVQLKHFVG